MRPVVIMLLAVLFSAASLAQVQVSSEPLVFESEEQHERFNRLTQELRCLVCQNQNLADSDAPLAHDLRQQLFEKMNEGLSDDEIKQFLVERYGDFVLYMPPVKGNTLLLWLTPLLLLLGGGTTIILNVRRRSRMLAEPNMNEKG